jgi:WD40 repeat protein
MHILQPAAASSLSLPASSYIYALSAASSSSEEGRLAAISSDDSLRIFDSRSLKLLSVASAKTHEGVTSLKEYRGDASGHGHGLLATAGRDGAIRLWDVRAAGQGLGKAAVEMKTGRYSSSV